ncbi:MAG: hypothetical protein R3D01_05725 [Hyphomicrobiales bacterium]
MRDIRGDLRDRVGLLKDQINAAEADFERHIEQLKQEHDGKLKDLRENLEAVNRLMGVEHKRLGGASSAPDAKAEPAEQKPQTLQGPQAQAPQFSQAQARPAQGSFRSTGGATAPGRVANAARRFPHAQAW